MAYRNYILSRFAEMVYYTIILLYYTLSERDPKNCAREIVGISVRFPWSSGSDNLRSK